MSDTAPSPLREQIATAMFHSYGQENWDRSHRMAAFAIRVIRNAVVEDPTRAEELGLTQVGWEHHSHLFETLARGGLWLSYREPSSAEESRPVFAFTEKEGE